MKKFYEYIDSNKTVIRIIHGPEVISLLHEESLQRKWSTLVLQCKKSSVFQSPDFVLTWYIENQKEFYPLVIMAFSADELVGILTLASKLNHNSGKPCRMIFGAGNHFAIYQTWLVLPNYREVFWENGIKQIFKQFPNCSINLKSIPDLDDYLVLSQRSDFKRMTAIEKSYNPILEFDDKNFEKIISKRHFKSKFNRLNRSGKVQLKKIEHCEELNAYFEKITLFYNLRHGAAFNKVPFPKGNNDKQLFLEWFRKGVLHSSILYLDGDLIGAIIMLDDFGKAAHLAGLIAYSPTHAKFSPGLVHLYLLAQMLKEESFQKLKLSPGYDAYKERFSNTHEELHELLISANIHQILRRKFRNKWRKFLLSKGIRPMEMAVFMDKKLANFKNKWFNWKNLLIKTKLSHSQILQKIMELDGEDISENKIQYHINQHSDLLLVNDFTFELSRWEFLEDSLKRLEGGQNFLTFVKREELFACLWYENDLKNDGDLNEVLNSQNISNAYFSANMVKLINLF